MLVETTTKIRINKENEDNVKSDYHQQHVLQWYNNENRHQENKTLQTEDTALGYLTNCCITEKKPFQGGERDNRY